MSGISSISKKHQAKQSIVLFAVPWMQDVPKNALWQGEIWIPICSFPRAETILPVLVFFKCWLPLQLWGCAVHVSIGQDWVAWLCALFPFSTGCSNWLEPRCPRAKSGWSQTCSCPWGVCHWCCMLDSMFCPELCDRMRTYNRVKKVCHPQYRLHPVTQICSGSRRKSLANGTCWWFRPGVAGRPPEGLQVISRV